MKSPRNIRLIEEDLCHRIHVPIIPFLKSLIGKILLASDQRDISDNSTRKDMKSTFTQILGAATKFCNGKNSKNWRDLKEQLDL